MERKQKMNYTSKYICVPQYDPCSSPLEIYGEMVYGTSKVNSGPGNDLNNSLLVLREVNKRKLEYFVCTSCTCKSTVVLNERCSDRGSKHVDDSDSSDEDLEVEDLLNILSRHQYKNHSQHGRNALLRLVTSFSGHGVTPDQLIQIQHLLRSQNPVLQESTLSFILQLCLHDDTAINISQHDLMNDIINILSSPNDLAVQSAAFKSLEKLFMYKSIADAWYDEVESSLLPSILRTYYDANPLAMKYSATCLLKSLSKHHSTACLLGPELMIILKQFKDSSSMLKEVFTEILINVYQNQGLVDSKLLDTSLLSTCSDLITDGPCSNQTMAMSLLSSLLKEDKYTYITINHQHIVASLISCLQLSDCKHVREAAGCSLSHVTKSSLSKVANAFMVEAALYFTMEDERETPHSKLVYPVTLKHQTDLKLWKAMDQFLKLIVKLFISEGKLIKNFSGNVCMDCNIQCDMSANQLGILIHLSSIISNICSWPVVQLKSEVTVIETKNLIDDTEIWPVLDKMNYQLTIKIWNKIGLQLLAVLSKYSRKLQINLDVAPDTDRSPSQQPEYLSDKEYELVLNILTVLSFICVAACQTFKAPDNRRCSTARNKHRGEKPIWVDDNPHLTGSVDRKMSHPYNKDDVNELLKEARIIRNEMYQHGLIQMLSPFLESKNTNIRVMSSFILRCSVKPTEDYFERDHDISCHPPADKLVRRRPQSAITRSNKNKIDIALYKMSPQLSSSMRNILQPRPSSASNKAMLPSKSVEKLKPITEQYQQSTVKECGPRLLKSIFHKSRDIKKSSLLLIQDLVKYGTVETHMELSQLGCIPKLIDFLRINEDDEMLEISALILTKMLVSSDFRLKQLFNRHGGSNLLMAMAQYSKGRLGDEVRSTLQTVTRGGEKFKHPVSAPSSEAHTPDVWDHIMGRWKQEDKVVQVLRKWLEEEETIKDIK